MSARADLIPLAGRGWPVIGSCIALIRLRDRPGFAVGVQSHLRADGIGRVWPSLGKAKRRASYLANLHQLPVVEAL